MQFISLGSFEFVREIAKNAPHALLERGSYSGSARSSDRTEETVAGGAARGRLFAPPRFSVEAFLEPKLASGLDGLAKCGGGGFDKEDVANERILRRVVDEGKKLDVFADSHEGKIADAAFRHHFASFFAAGSTVRRRFNNDHLSR